MDIDFLVEKVHRLLLDNLPIRTSKTPSGWNTMDCPMCTDKRKRGGLITTGAKISYNCFNCGFTTGWEPNPTLGKKFKQLATTLGADQQDIHKVTIELMKYSEQLETESASDYVYNLQKFNTEKIPETASAVDDLKDGHAVKEYARQRGLLGLYPLLYFDEKLYKQRLVVPFTYNNEVVGWTGRHISPPDKQTPKYLHKMQPGYVFNIDRFADSKRQIVIVTEGVFDAILIDGVAIQGNSVGPEQAHLIEKLGKRIIVCPDKDEAGIELMLQAAELGWEVSFPPWHIDCKDAADAVQRYGRMATVSSIIKHATNNKLKIEVKAKMI
jgi:transposase-like protein